MLVTHARVFTIGKSGKALRKNLQIKLQVEFGYDTVRSFTDSI